MSSSAEENETRVRIMARLPKKSSKGKLPAKSAKTAGSVSPLKRPTGTAKAPPKPTTAPASKIQILDMLRKMGATDDIVNSVAKLQQPGSSTTQSATPTRDLQSASRDRLTKLLMSYVQHARQRTAWGKVPPFLSTSVSNLVASIRPPGGPDEALTRALQAHGDVFSQAVTKTTWLHVVDKQDDVKRSLEAWRDMAVVDEAKKIALGRLLKLYGTKPKAVEIPEHLEEAAAAIPRRSWLEMMEDEEEVEGATRAPST